MRQTKYAVRLSEAERAQFRTLVERRVVPARFLAHARILLKAACRLLAASASVHPRIDQEARR